MKGQSDSRSESSVDSEGSSHNPAGRRQLAVLSLVGMIAKLLGRIALSWKHRSPILTVEK